MANKTIYPYGQDGQLPSGYPMADDLKTDSAQIALTARQGMILGNRTTIIDQVTPIERKTGKYLLAAGTLSDAGDSAVVDVFQVGEHTDNILASGRVPSSVLYAMVAFYEADGTFISSAILGDGESAKNYQDEEIAVPANAALVYVQGNTNYLEPGMKSVSVVNKAIIGMRDDVTIHPTIEYGAFRSTSGLFSEMQSAAGGAATTYNRTFIRTPKYIRLGNSKKFNIKVDAGMQFRAFCYDQDFSFMFVTPWTDLTANVEKTLDLEMAQFVRFDFRTNSSYPVIPLFNLELTGDFPKEFEYFNKRTADDGYQTLALLADVIDATASDADTNSVQDVSNFKFDHGILVLPPNYSNTGKPTRLIIYCHGAGINYDGNTTRFPDTDLLPDYWLSEGCAILDVDGEFYDTIHQHAYLPEARQAYVAAYHWVIRNYNICRDGVFLCGRSMGGGMCFDLMECNEIPVIACCPIVPVCNTLWWWNYCPKAYREDNADKLGFEGVAPTWTSDNPMTESEWNYLKANFEKLVKYAPLWRCIVDLPGKDTLFDGMRIASTTISGVEVEAEASVYANLHARVKCPVKIFDCYTDPVVPYNRNALLMYKMLVNAGNICELRMFDAQSDEDTSITAHHFELRSDRLITWTNSYGETLQNVPVVYIEAMKFWRRYEQVNGV